MTFHIHLDACTTAFCLPTSASLPCRRIPLLSQLPAYRSTRTSPEQGSEATRSFSVMLPGENMHLVTSNVYLGDITSLVRVAPSLHQLPPAPWLLPT